MSVESSKCVLVEMPGLKYYIFVISVIDIEPDKLYIEYSDKVVYVLQYICTKAKDKQNCLYLDLEQVTSQTLPVFSG